MQMRRALIVGIDHYKTAPLSGCVNDANRVEKLLRSYEDGSSNFDCRLLVSTDDAITRAGFKHAVMELFKDEADVALLYFSGHGAITDLGGYLVTQDSKQYDEGVSMTDILTLANKSEDRIRDVVIILDCCYSGAFGANPVIDSNLSYLKRGISILTASRESQTASEVTGGGVFTSLLCDALDGGASDVRGNVTVASVYSYIDEVLGAWDQRPLFKSNVSRFFPIRKCKPEIAMEILRLLPKYFSDPYDELPLDPSFEPSVEPKNEENEKIFDHLQKFRATRLLVPVGEDHMFYAAMNSKSCKLTPLGRFYWNLANSGKL